MRRVSILLAGGALAVAGITTSGSVAGTSPAEAAAGDASTTARADFNGDGYSDLALPVDEVGDDSRPAGPPEGGFHVLYGGPGGVAAAGDQLFIHGMTGLKAPQSGPIAAMTTGDFNADGFADLVTGRPDYDDSDGLTGGVVGVLYGTPDGLTVAGDDLWHPWVNEFRQAGILPDFGAAVAAGDFDGDGDDDLAVGSPFEAGNVTIIQGSPTGLSPEGFQVWDRDAPGIVAGDTIGDDAFGAGLVAGNFGRGAFDDLAIRVLEDDRFGAVHVLYGSATGLNTTGNQYWNQDSPGVRGIGFDERFGHAMAAADLGRTVEDDLAISTLHENDGVRGGGAVNVLYGSADGLTAQDDQYWQQDSAGIAGNTERSDLFGADLAAADFGRDGRADLAIGAPGETTGGVVQSGVVHVLYGSGTGLTASGDQLWHRNRSGVLGANTPLGRFGETLFAADLGQSRQADLSVAVPGQRTGGEEGAGAVHLLYGAPNGLTASGDNIWHQDSAGVLDHAEEFEFFGLLSRAQ